MNKWERLFSTKFCQNRLNKMAQTINCAIKKLRNSFNQEKDKEPHFKVQSNF